LHTLSKIRGGGEEKRRTKAEKEKELWKAIGGILGGKKVRSRRENVGFLRV